MASGLKNISKSYVSFFDIYSRSMFLYWWLFI